MSKHINTHLFFHMKDPASKQTNSGSTTTPHKPKKPSSSLNSGYEIDTNPPIVPESGDYYDYYTNYGIPDYFGPDYYAATAVSGGGGTATAAAGASAGAAVYGGTGEQNQYYHNYRNSEYYEYDNNADDLYAGGGAGGAGYQNNVDYDRSQYVGHTQQRLYATNNGHPVQQQQQQQRNAISATSSPYHTRHETQLTVAGHGNNSLSYLQPNSSLSTSNIGGGGVLKRGGTSHLSNNDLAYRYDQQGLSAIAHRLHRITFVEACLHQPPDLSSPSLVRAPGGLPGSSGQGGGGGPPRHGTGDRSPTGGGTGSAQYYQEWAGKHMRHLSNNFERPTQQHILMNVERKSKYPFIILCTPERSTSCLSKSSSSNSSTRMSRTYQREISQHSAAYSYEEEEDDDEEAAAVEEARWMTQKQRDGYQTILPPPPPPLPHIWPELRYVDGLYTVCDSIVRPGSGIPDDGEEDLLFLGGGGGGGAGQSQQDMSNHSSYSDQYQHPANMYDNSIYGNQHHQHHQHHQDKGGHHVTFQKTEKPRPSGYIVSAFATFPGEDSERLEKNWQSWTGAQILYNRLPMYVGLRRLIFLKRIPDDINAPTKTNKTMFTGFTYVLLCECYSLKNTNIASVCTTIDNLRARCCGYSALYLTHSQQHHQQQQQQQHQGGSLQLLQPGGYGQRQYMQQMSAPAANHYGGGYPQGQLRQQQHHQAQASMGAYHRQQQQQQQQQHHQHQHQHHYVPRHHRSTSDFTAEFD